MGRLMISSSQMCISREQEKFLAAYRTDEARQVFIDSYGKEKVDFLNSGFDGDNSLPIFNPFEILSLNGVSRGGVGPFWRKMNRIVFSNTLDFTIIKFLYIQFVGPSTRIPVSSWIPTGYRYIYDIGGGGSVLGLQVSYLGLLDNKGSLLYQLRFRTDANLLLPDELFPIIRL